MANVIVTSFEGKALRVAFSDDRRDNRVALFIDEAMHAEKIFTRALFSDAIISKENEPMLEIEYPFPSGTKRIKFFYKDKFLGYKCKLCIDGKKLLAILFKERYNEL